MIGQVMGEGFGGYMKLQNCRKFWIKPQNHTSVFQNTNTMAEFKENIKITIYKLFISKLINIFRIKVND